MLQVLRGYRREWEGGCVYLPIVKAVFAVKILMQVQPCTETIKTLTWWLNLAKSLAQLLDAESYSSLIFSEPMPFRTSFTKTGSVFIDSLGKSTYGESVSTPEGLPSLGDGLGSKLFEDLVCTAQ